jgi:hypothetical protein
MAQIGGESTYKFLSLSPTARVTALGGTNISIVDWDPSIQLSNPAALNPSMHRRVQASTVIYPGLINFGNVSYAHKFKVPGTFGFGLQYMAYGGFKETDIMGNQTGLFNAGEMNVYAGYGYQFGKIFSVGANGKFIYSRLADWHSVGLATDLAFTINDTAHYVTATVAAKNIGVQAKPYVKGNRESLPFDLQAGLSFSFKNAPMRFHFTFHNLYRWDIRYNNPADQESETIFGDTTATKAKKYIADKLFRHVIVGVEFNIKKVVRLQVAYNHQRQQELRLTTRRGVPGLSFGLGVHIKQFDFQYALQPMAQGQTLNHFTLSINTAGFNKKMKGGPTPDEAPKKKKGSKA